MATPYRGQDRKNIMVPGRGVVALGQIYRDEPADYTTGAMTFTAGTEALQVNIPIQNDAHFLCVETTFTNSLDVCAGGSTVPVFLNGGGTMQVTPGKTQKPIQQAPVPLKSIAGDGRFPYIWPLPYLFVANAPLTVLVTAAGTAAPSMALAVIRVTFHGYKVPLSVIDANGNWVG